MDLTADLPDSRGNFMFVWPLHDPVALINTRPPIFTRHLWIIALFLTWRQNADHFSMLVYGTQKSITKGSAITIHAQVFEHCPNSFCTPPPILKWALWATFCINFKCHNWRHWSTGQGPKCLLRHLQWCFPNYKNLQETCELRNRNQNRDQK